MNRRSFFTRLAGVALLPALARFRSEPEFHPEPGQTLEWWRIYPEEWARFEELTGYPPYVLLDWP